MDCYLKDYQPGLELKIRTLNSEHLKKSVGGAAEQELSGKGYADFTMVFETRYSPQIERTYFKGHIEVNDKGEVNSRKSSMVYEKAEKLEYKKGD